MRRAILSAARRLAAFPARLAAGDFLAVFNFHQVSPEFDPRRQIEWTWTSLAHLERQLDWVRNEFEIVPLYDGVQRMKAGTLGGPCAAITFDDGDISLQRWTIPLLRRLLIPATLFVNSGYWEERPTYWAYLIPYLSNHPDEARREALRQALGDHARLLRNTTIGALYRELRARVEALWHLVEPEERFVVSREFLWTLEPALFSICPHGREHQRFSMMPERWQREAVDDDLSALRELPGFRPLFAVPFGRPHDWDETAARIAEERGLTLVLADGGINRNGDTVCRRIPADGADAGDLFRRTLLGW